MKDKILNKVIKVYRKLNKTQLKNIIKGYEEYLDDMEFCKVWYDNDLNEIVYFSNINNFERILNFRDIKKIIEPEPIGVFDCSTDLYIIESNSDTFILQLDVSFCSLLTLDEFCDEKIDEFESEPIY